MIYPYDKIPKVLRENGFEQVDFTFQGKEIRSFEHEGSGCQIFLSSGTLEERHYQLVRTTVDNWGIMSVHDFDEQLYKKKDL